MAEGDRGRTDDPRASEPEETPLAGQPLTTSRGTIQVWRGGSGPLLCLLHDIGTTHRSFSRVIPGLTASFKVCAPDLLGHGASAREVRDLSVANQAAALREVLDDLRLQDAVIVGHALGGSVALRLAASAPERTRKLVLIAAGAPAGKLPLALRLLRNPPIWTVLGLLGRRLRRRCVARVTGREDSRELERSEAVEGREGWKVLGRAFRQTTSTEALAEMDTLVDRYLRHPTLVLWGSEDPLSPVSAAQALYQERRNVRIIEIAGGSHVPHEDHPDIVADLIRDFLE